MFDDITTAILAAEHGRAAAMLVNDTAALDRLLDARLYFSHATGQVDDKAAYMAKMASGRIDYLSIDWSEQRVTRLGEANAFLTGRMSSQVRVEGVEKELDNRVMAIWSLENGDWRMLAFQSTPLKA